MTEPGPTKGNGYPYPWKLACKRPSGASVITSWLPSQAQCPPCGYDFVLIHSHILSPPPHKLKASNKRTTIKLLSYSIRFKKSNKNIRLYNWWHQTIMGSLRTNSPASPLKQFRDIQGQVQTLNTSLLVLAILMKMNLWQSKSTLWKWKQT